MSRPILSEKQQEFWRNCEHRWNVKTGATRSGKTYMDYYLIPRRILAVKGKEGLCMILGHTRETIRRNILLPMQAMYGANRVSGIHVDNSCTMFGERVICLGADAINRVDAIRGSSIKYCYGDEVTTWNEEVFTMLKSRLDKEYSRFDGTCNPAAPTHWFKAFLDTDADIYQQAYTIDDNPFLPESFVENLKKEYAGTVYYKRYILGEWAMADGLVYPMYLDAIGEPPEKDEFGKPYADDMCISMDYGTQNAFAAILWEKYGTVWYATREYYYSGRATGVQKTDGDYLEDLNEWRSDIPSRLLVIIDPSAASFIALLKKSGLYKVKTADNAVDDGLRETALAMQNGKIKVSKRLVNWRKEIEGYVWDEKSLLDRPVKVNDHLMDSMRYCVHTLGIAKNKRPVTRADDYWMM